MGTMNSYSKSWVGKEEGNFAWQTNFVGDANIQIAPAFRIENNLQVQFGKSKIQPVDDDGNRGSWQEWAVSSDKIDFQNLEIFTINERIVSPFIGARVQTTFMDQVPDNHKVKYFNLVTTSQSAGAQFVVLNNQRNQNMTWRLGAATYQRINRKINTDHDAGAELVGNYSANLKEGLMTYTMYLNLYQPFVASDRDNDKWKAMKVDWRNDLGINVTRFVMISYSAQVLYDREWCEDAQFRQMLSAGFTIAANNDKRRNRE